MSAQDVAAAFLRHARESLGAVDAAIYLTSGSSLRRAEAFGVPERWPEVLPREDAGHPLCGATVEWIEGARALVARFPSQADLPWREMGAWCFVPLGREGAACLGFDRPGGVTEQDRRLGALLSDLCVDALERARLLALRDEFLQVASHELRTPLTSLAVQVAILKKSAPSAQLGVIERQVTRISSLIARLLDVTATAGGSLYLDLSEMDLAAAVRDIAQRLAPEMERERCRLEVHAPAPVIGRWDPLRVEQVVVNLCVNAAKFAPGTTVLVQVRAEGGEAVLSVTDHGVGIAPEDLDRIFNKFERAAPSSDYGGLGLGLFVVREVVRAFGGRVEVQSQLGQGSTFTVRLPGALPEAR